MRRIIFEEDREINASDKKRIFINTKKVNKKFLNLENLDFDFINKSLTIVVGKNNVGKTKLLEYIFEKSDKWDGFENKEKGIKSLPLFFKEKINIYDFDDKYYSKLDKEKRIRYDYEVYYFDLESSFFPLIEKHKTEKEIRKEVSFKNGKKRGCWVYCTERNIEGWELKSLVMENEKIEEIELIEPLMLKVENKEDDFDIDVDNRVGGRNNAIKISHPLSWVGSGLIKSRTLQSLIEKIIEKKESKNSKLSKNVHFWPYEPKIYVPILLIDEPEILLHPSLINE